MHTLRALPGTFCSQWGQCAPAAGRTPWVRTGTAGGPRGERHGQTRCLRKTSEWSRAGKGRLAANPHPWRQSRGRKTWERTLPPPLLSTQPQTAGYRELEHITEKQALTRTEASGGSIPRNYKRKERWGFWLITDTYPSLGSVVKCYESDLKDHKGTRTKEGTAVERQQKAGKQKASEGVTRGATGCPWSHHAWRDHSSALKRVMPVRSMQGQEDTPSLPHLAHSSHSPSMDQRVRCTMSQMNMEVKCHKTTKSQAEVTLTVRPLVSFFPPCSLI